MDIEPNPDIPFIMGRPFTKTTRMMVYIDKGDTRVMVIAKEVCFTVFEIT